MLRNPPDEQLRRLERAVRAGVAGAGRALIALRRRMGMPSGLVGRRTRERLAVGRRLAQQISPVEMHDSLDVGVPRLADALRRIETPSNTGPGVWVENNIFYDRDGSAGVPVTANLPRMMGSDGRDVGAWADYYLERRLDGSWAILWRQLAGGSVFREGRWEGRNLDALIRRAAEHYSQEVALLEGGRQQNPGGDEELRALERQIREGVPGARQRLRAARGRRGMVVPKRPPKGLLRRVQTLMQRVFALPERRVRPLFIDSDGKFGVTNYAWPGGYPMFYLQRDGETVCPACAEKFVRGEYDTSNRDYDIVDADVNWEDGAMFCANCNERIPSAYGDPADEDLPDPGLMRGGSP